MAERSAAPGRRAVLAALLAAGVGGCARLPTSGPVQARSPAPGDDLGPRPVALPPQPGADPRTVVEGFLRAAAVGSADYADARAYLADESVEWAPESAVLLHAGAARITVVSGPGAPADTAPSPGPSPTPTPPPRPGATAEVVVGLDALATLDGDGRLALLDAPQRRRARFRLVAVAGEWRISELADGVLLSLGQFVTSTFRSTPVYFPDVTGGWLVPDVRYVRQDTPFTQTQVVTTLLDGPAPWLAPALSLPPVRPRLSVSSVPVRAGIATVDLTEEALTLDAQRQALLTEQLERSLAAVQGTLIARVELTVKGQRLGVGGPVGGVPQPPGPLPAPAVQARSGPVLLGVEAGPKARLVTTSAAGGQITPVAGIELAGGARPAMSYGTDPRTYALVVPGRSARTLAVATPGGPVGKVVSAPDLTPPSFDPLGWVWTSPRVASRRVVAGFPVAGGEVERVDVAADWLTAGQVVALRVSREGARAVLLVDTVAPGGRRTSRLLLCGVQRAGSGEPLALTGPVRLFADLDRASDVGWLDDAHVVVLGSRTGDEDRVVSVQPWVVDVGGDPSSRGIEGTAGLGSIVTDARGQVLSTPARWARLGPDDAPSLAVGDGLDALFVSTARGDLFRYRLTGSWEGVRPAVVRPAFAG